MLQIQHATQSLQQKHIIINVHKIHVSNTTLRVTVERKMNVQCKEDIERLMHSLNVQILKNAKKIYLGVTEGEQKIRLYNHMKSYIS